MAKKILIVDDDDVLRSELRDFLEDYEVVEASNGEEALKLLKKANNIDLVVLDVIMPGLSGIDILSRIKKIDQSIRIIILTGYSSKDVAISALKAHADDYIEKPLDLEKTREIINDVLEVSKDGGPIDASDIKSKIEKVKRFTERNCLKKVSLKEAADIIYVSSKYLSRIFKQIAGKTFSQFKLEIKIKKAKELLTETGYNINQIADKLGYENTESFIRQFKKNANYTPTEFRMKVKQANGDGRAPKTEDGRRKIEDRR